MYRKDITWKQSWRRMSTKGLERSPRSSFTSDPEVCKITEADEYVPTPPTTPPTSPQRKQPKKVYFNQVVKVFLIPSRPEYIEHDLVSVLWWEGCDYTGFKQSAVKELIAYISTHPSLSTREALRQLYQPGAKAPLSLAKPCVEQPYQPEGSPDEECVGLVIDDVETSQPEQAYLKETHRETRQVTPQDLPVLTLPPSAPVWNTAVPYLQKSVEKRSLVRNITIHSLLSLANNVICDIPTATPMLQPVYLC